MSKAISFIAYKAFRDSTGKLYTIFEGYDGDPVVSVKTTYQASKTELKTTETGQQELSAAFSKVPDSISTLNVEVTLESGTTKGLTLKIPNSKQKLLEPYDALRESTTIDLDGVNNTISISDALYYGKSKYKQLYIFPSSSTSYLDTSSKKDYYYVSDGGAAYLGSNDLQNAFLNELDYAVKGYSTAQLGRFIGGDNNKTIFYDCYSDLKKTGPAVFGGVTLLDSSQLAVNQLTVCTNPASSNYYLTGCVNEAWPCIPATGGSFSTACDGSTLTLDVINNWTVLSGDCCLTCDNYSVSAVMNEASDNYAADGSLDITVSNGAANYAYTFTPVSLEGVNTAAYTPLDTSSTSATWSLTNLYAGTYTLTITDANSCVSQKDIYISAAVAGASELWGCGPSGSSSAINYDAAIGAAYETDALCVYCNATTGLLEHGTDTAVVSNVLGAWAKLGFTNFTSATTNIITGAALANGSVTFNDTFLYSYQLLGPNPADYNVFDANEWFSGSPDASPYSYVLYKISQNLDYGSQADGDNVKGAITGDSGTSTISTTANASTSGFAINNLAYGRYVVILSYTNGDAVKEYEECYAVKEFQIPLTGCTNPDAPNYNAAVTVPDDSICISNECNPEAFNAPFNLFVSPNCSIYIQENDWLANNPAIYDAVNNGYNPVGTTGYTILPQYGSTGSLYGSVYVLENIFCGLYANAGANAFTPTTTLSNGVSFANIPNFNPTGLSLIVPVFTVAFADGTEFIITATESDIGVEDTLQLSLSNLLYDFPTIGTPQQNETIGSFNCDYILAHGNITTITTQINYGEPGVWDQVYTSVWSNTADNFTDLVEDCQNYSHCTEPQEVYGCPDQTASNYNPEATSDDGTCTYPEPEDVPGCTDPEAINYN